MNTPSLKMLIKGKLAKANVIQSSEPATRQQPELSLCEQ